MAKTRKTPGRRPKTAAAAAKKGPGVQLTEGDRDLLRRLSERTGMQAQEVLERALAGYAATAAPGMPLHPEPARNTRKGEPPQKLFLSVDGRPEVAVDKTEFVLGSGEGLALQLDLPRLSPRHARTR